MHRLDNLRYTIKNRCITTVIIIKYIKNNLMLMLAMLFNLPTLLLTIYCDILQFPGIVVIDVHGDKYLFML